MLVEVRKKIDSIKPFKVSFTNQVVSDHEVDIEEKGEMTFLDSQTIKWEYLVPDHKIWILSGDTFEYYDAEEEQVTRGTLTKKAQLWIFQILYDNVLDDDIRIDHSARSIHFLNREDAVDIKIFFAADFLPSRIIQKDPTGVSIIYIFSEYRTNIALGRDEFKLKTDGNVDIIELE